MNGHAEGGEVYTPKMTVHTHTNVQRFLKDKFGDLPEFRRSILLNEMETMCKSWFIAGGGDVREFETRFNNQQNTRS